MKRVIFDEPTISNVVDLSGIPDIRPIFAKKDGKLFGMVRHNGKGWTIVGVLSSAGHSDTRRECLRQGAKLGYEFWVEE